MGTTWVYSFSQQVDNVEMTLYGRRCDVITSHRRLYEVISDYLVEALNVQSVHSVGLVRLLPEGLNGFRKEGQRNSLHGLNSKPVSTEMPRTECGPLRDLSRPYFKTLDTVSRDGFWKIRTKSSS